MFFLFNRVSHLVSQGQTLTWCARTNLCLWARKQKMDYFGEDVDLKVLLELLKADDDPIVVHQHLVNL